MNENTLLAAIIGIAAFGLFLWILSIIQEKRSKKLATYTVTGEKGVPMFEHPHPGELQEYVRGYLMPGETVVIYDTATFYCLIEKWLLGEDLLWVGKTAKPKPNGLLLVDEAGKRTAHWIPPTQTFYALDTLRKVQFGKIDGTRKWVNMTHLKPTYPQKEKR